MYIHVLLDDEIKKIISSGKDMVVNYSIVTNFSELMYSKMKKSVEVSGSQTGISNILF